MASDDPVREVATWIGSGVGGGLIGYLARLFVIERGKLRLEHKTHDQSKALKEADSIMEALTAESPSAEWQHAERQANNWRRRYAAGEFDTVKERKE